MVYYQMSSAVRATYPDRDRLITQVLLGSWVALTLWQQWNHWAQDLSAVYIGGWLWHIGRPDLIYAAPAAFFGGAAESWQPVMESLGIGDRVSFAYIYAPLWAAVAAPITAMTGPQGFINAVMLVQIPLLGASVHLAGKVFRPAAMPLWLWTTLGIVTLSLSIQSFHAIWHGQPTITVGFLILLAFERLDARHPLAAGAALALAASIKLMPAIFVLVFLFDRQFRATAAFVVFGAMLALLSVLLAGWPLHLEFLASLHKVSSVAILSGINVSLLPAALALGAATGLLPAIDPDAKTLLFAAPPVWVGPAIMLAGLGVIVAMSRVSAALPARMRRGIGLFALAIILALFGPLGWLHYYLLPMLLLPGLFGILPRSVAGALILLVGLPSLAPVFSLVAFPASPVADYVWYMCVAWLAVLVGLYVAASRASSR